MPDVSRHLQRRRAYLPLWMAVVLAGAVLIALGVWTYKSMSSETADGRQTIVFWGAQHLGEDIYAIINQFEHLPENLDPQTGKPKYKVILGNATSPDIAGDAQRLLCAVAGEVPPDVVWFDRFAIGEWAGRDALQDLSPYIDAQPKDDPNRLNLDDYYKWAVEEASYRPPGSTGKFGVYGIPLDVDMRLLYINSDLLRQEGFVDPVTKEPRPPKNWDELKQYTIALTRFKRPGDPTSGIARLGAYLGNASTSDSGLYLYSWQAGGALMSPDGTRVTLDSPPVVRALRYMTDVYDSIGGFAQILAFQQSYQAGELDPFLRGSVAMKVETTYAMSFIADWRPNFDFLLVPVPMPADRVNEPPVTWGGGYSLIMPKTAQNKEGGWRLIRYLTSKPVQMQLQRGIREQKEAEGRIYLPGLSANRVVFESLLAKYIDGNASIPPRIRQAYATIKRMMPLTLHRPVTPVGQLLWNQQFKAYEDSVRHTFRDQARAELGPRASPDQVTDRETQLTLASAQRPVQRMLNELLAPLPPQTTVNWTPWLVSYGVICLLPFAGIFAAYKLRRRHHSYQPREVGAAILFASPWMFGFLVFVGGPIFFSVLFSFTRYNVLSPAHWVGLDNFRLIFHDALFYKALGNTGYMLIRIPLTMVASLVIAILLNRAIRGMSFYRTACYMPAIVPIVASSLLWVWIFNPAGGILNTALSWFFDTRPMEWFQHAIGHHFTPPLWLQSETWSKPALILMSLWSAGAGMIIWLAGLQSIPQQLYEAASIDGANAWRRFWNVTVPMLSPYILFNLIIGVIGTMQIFNEAFVMTQGGPADSTLFYAYHLFRQAFQYFRMGYASALAWILFLIVLGLTMLQLWLSKKWVVYDRT